MQAQQILGKPLHTLLPNFQKIMDALYKAEKLEKLYNEKNRIRQSLKDKHVPQMKIQ